MFIIDFFSLSSPLSSHPERGGKSPSSMRGNDASNRFLPSSTEEGEGKPVSLQKTEQLLRTALQKRGKGSAPHATALTAASVLVHLFVVRLFVHCLPLSTCSPISLKKGERRRKKNKPGTDPSSQKKRNSISGHTPLSSYRKRGKGSLSRDKATPPSSWTE
jgi:hypothetical protein